MGAKKKAAKKGGDSMIISKSRVKVAATTSNVGSEVYGALEAHVRELIANAEKRAAANGRKTPGRRTSEDPTHWRRPGNPVGVCV